MSSQPDHKSNLVEDPLFPDQEATSTSTTLLHSLHVPAETPLKEDEDGSNGAKKQDHNARERLRRMKLHASYLTLGTLLPDSSSSFKKKWCAPSIIDRMVGYIPKLQAEVEQLILKKQQIVEAMERRKSEELELSVPPLRTISVHELGESSGEAIVQICRKKEKEDEFSNLLRVMEAQGLSILSASTAQVCRDQQVICYHFHVKMGEKGCGDDHDHDHDHGHDDYITMLKKNIILSLS